MSPIVINKVVHLQPDLVIGFSDIQASIARDLIAAGIPVWINNHRSVTGIYEMIVQLGSLVGQQDKALQLVNQCRNMMKLLKPGEYYGVKKADTNRSGVLLSEYNYFDPYTDWHYHENPYFMYVLRGKVRDISKKATENCQAGSLIFHNWNEAHYNTKDSLQAGGFHIEFPRAWFNDKKLDINLWEGSSLIRNPKAHLLVAKLYFEFRFQDCYSDLSRELLMIQLCENIQYTEFPTSHQPPWVSSLRQMLDEDVEDLNLNLLSKELGVHPVHISRAFPKYFASSLGDYVRQQKIKQSMTYLFDNMYSLTEIANICGFADQSHFTRTFKAYLNKTPSAFRKQVL